MYLPSSEPATMADGKQCQHLPSAQRPKQPKQDEHEHNNEERRGKSYNRVSHCPSLSRTLRADAWVERPRQESRQPILEVMTEER